MTTETQPGKQYAKNAYYSKRPAGRPKGTTKYAEKATAHLTIRLTPTAYAWAKSQSKGWVAEWLEGQARKGLSG